MQQAAARTKKSFELAELARPDRDSRPVFSADACRKAFHHLMDITSRLRADCKARLYFQISPENAALYHPTEPPFGEDVERVFRMAIDDIAEAGKCLALGQGTATVFHLMRVMEAGLCGLAAELGVPYAPSWESYITQHVQRG